MFALFRVACLTLMVFCMSASADTHEEIVINFDEHFEVGLDKERVQSMLNQYGVENGSYYFLDGVFVTTDVNVAIIVNRIKAYANTSESIPYFLLVLEKKDLSDKHKFCITQNPYAIDESVSWETTVVRSHNKKNLRNGVPSLNLEIASPICKEAS